MFVCMYGCMYVYMHVHRRISPPPWGDILRSMCVCVCVCVCMCVCTCVCHRVCACIHYIAHTHTLSLTHVHAHIHTHTHTSTVLPLTSWSAPRARIIEYALCPYISRKMLREVFALASFTVKIRASSHACASSSGTRCSYVLPVCVCIYM